MKADESKAAKESVPEEIEALPPDVGNGEQAETPDGAIAQEADSCDEAPDDGNGNDQEDVKSPSGNEVAANLSENDPKEEKDSPDGELSTKNDGSLIKKNKKVIAGCAAAVGVAILAALTNCLVIPYTTYLDAKSKFENKEYAAAVESYAKIPGFLDSDELKSTAENASNYALGVKALDKKDYAGAIDYFAAAGNYEDASEQLEHAEILKTYAHAEDDMKNGDYESAGYSYASILDYKDSMKKAATCADNLMKSENYSVAKKLYDKLGSDYKEQANKAQAVIDNQESMRTAEDKISNGDFAGALELYNQVPDDFTQDGKKAGERKQQLNNAIEASKAAGTFSATNANVKVTQTSRNTGNWYYWTSEDTIGAKITVEAAMADDGTISLNGTVTYWRYGNYSSVSSALKYRTVKEEFTCGANPGTIQLDDETSLSYDGSWHLRFKRVDNSQDVYFSYTYEAYFDYSK